ncbi:MAG: hypothetical protein ABFD10_22035 [Prolixibacteraceae bacterium]
MTIYERAKAPKPRFFRILRTIGLALAAAGAAIIAAPVSLPAGISALGGYLALGGAVLTAVSQVTVEQEEQRGRK